MTTDNLNNLSTQMTLEQLRQLEIYQSRLSNLQNEIKNAMVEKSILTNDLARIYKEKDYNQGLLDSLTTQVKESGDKLTSLNETHLTVSDNLAKLNAEIQQKSSAMIEKEMALKDREALVEASELSATAHNEKLLADMKVHEGNRKEFNEKVAKLKEIVKIF